VNQYERQRHQPAYEIVRRLAEVLKKPPPFFYATDESLAELIAAYGRASAVGRAKLLSVVKTIQKE
jgi:hypothetical protein